MSTTTNFKRIALVAVAALGLGVLSSVPSNAAINADTLTLSATTASQSTAETYTASSAVATVSFFGALNDSVSVTAALTAAPAGNTALPTLQLVETSSAFVDSASANAKRLNDTVSANTATKVQALSSSVVTTAKFAVYLTKGDGITAPTVAGTYSVKLTPAAIGVGALQGSAAVTLTITVTEAASLDTKASASTSKVYIQGVYNPAGKTAAAADSAVTYAKSPNANGTAGQAAFIVVNQLNAAGGASSDSLTAEISGPGTLGSGAYDAASRGRALTVKIADSITVWSDGSSGVSTITIKSASSGATIATKTLKFYGAMASLTGTAVTEIIGTSGTVRVSAKDATSVAMGSLIGTEALYAFSSDATVATVPTTAISNYAVESGTVTVTAVKAGTATITFGNASTLAASTIKSAPVTVRVGSTAIASVTLAFDKTSYAPGEKATITLSTLDATNLLTVPGAVTLFATGKGLNPDKAFLTGTTDTVTTTSITTEDATDATAGTVAGKKIYTVFMPTTPGPVKISATLSADAKLAAAIQGTVVSATVNVVDSGSAALAAVTALATTVASLRTLIVTLTNLVLKIQKKVKA
jgi:hypothetical protein